ncbi:hypothetical protein PICMEDRAFT_14416 [Pichia membranifaciens NRRL Y-2026]|uniref:Protein EFR3 n=1 Tax=Pichia membranifaciens NRRL Y-2026 TaxID=763406 RepID=A0A1E3NTK5_9ASCO|nr:hypothetical protein PICMEDRAFT_14416 [Pichia membranifaciens NRRL Y-2026]ODQ48893.1 hypothetical protein PICMEDRAFT_14416 [Pichia membranifaciens NRRL Y-2026]
MHSVFRPKHQKLILQCYPSPKLSTAETKPNQAELSYLVFYASSRRTKLEKVGEFLLKKTSADISHKRVGHLKVTLYILQELITKCSEDLGFMTPYVVNIMKDIVDLGDLSTCQLATRVFVTYCHTLQPIQRQVFSSNVNLLKKFLSIIAKFLSFASGSNSNDWLKMSLNICSVVADYVDPWFSQFENYDLIGKSIYLILGTLALSKTDLSLIKVSSSRSTPEVSDDDDSIDKLASDSLKSFFDTSSKNQLDSATKTVLSYVIENNKDLDWANKVVKICTRKTHIELRHRIMIIFSYEIDNYVKKNNIQLLEYLLKMQANLLGSDDVQFVGLPVMDILNKIIQFEQTMVLNKEAHILKSSYSDMIRSLAGRIYYNNQINDMVTSILSDYYNEYNNGKLTEDHFLPFSQVLIDNIRDILIVSEKTAVKLKKSQFPLSIFNYLYLVIPLEKFPNIRQQVQVMWLSLLNDFYRKDVETLSTPNVDLCITNNVDNNLCLFFESMDKLLKNSPRDEIKAQLSITVSTMISAFKLNFLMNYLKFTSVWLTDPTDFKYSLSLLILGLSSAHIEDGQPLAALADSKIACSQQEKLWPEYIGYNPTSAPSGGPLTTEELQVTLEKVPSVSTWLRKVSISQPPSVTSQPPKQHSTLLLMSASNSVLSLPLGKQDSFMNGNMKSLPRSITHSHNNTQALPLSAHSTLNSSIYGGRTEDYSDAADMTNSTADFDSSYNEDEMLSNGGDYSDMNYNFAAPGGGRSMRSGWSIRSARSGRSGRVNLRQLKEFKGNAANEVDLAKLVKTRTGGTLAAISTYGSSNGTNGISDGVAVANTNDHPAAAAAVVPVNGALSNGYNSVSSTVRGRSGLAFAISGLDLDDM